eukprot:Opistho-2@56696
MRLVKITFVRIILYQKDGTKLHQEITLMRVSTEGIYVLRMIEMAIQKKTKRLFFMTNMVPQAPENNRGIWKHLEEYTRTLLDQGNELYILAGTLGQGGTGSNGTTKTIGKNNNIVVPASIWKVIVVLPVGEYDAVRVNTTTRVIAVNMPNLNSVGAEDWKKYRISVDELERLTGYDFLSNVPTNIQKVIENVVDKE